MKTLLKILLGLSLALALLLIAVALFDVKGQAEIAGQIQGPALPSAWVEQRQTAQANTQAKIAPQDDKQILFGDLHVHSTFSIDAFLWSLPIMNGNGVHPPADACDYARYCSNLDFWSLTDHAESLTPRHWSLIKDTVRQCNAATNPDNPDLVTFLGWEWTQVGQTPESHYGHRNVVLLETDEDKVPARPITSGGLPLKHMRRRAMSPAEEALAPYITNITHRQQMKDQFKKQADLRASVDCPEGVHVRDLPPDCIESAETPHALWTKLDQWDTEVMAIPHGTSWGFYTPPGAKWDKQLTSKQHNPRYQKLMEVFSGHGNSEEYRDFRAVEYADDGSLICPQASASFLPCCQRAGQLIRARCDDPTSPACQSNVETAQQDYLNAGVAGHLVVPGVEPEDWLNCGQCTDCYLPALNYRPGNSAQYVMALSNFDDTETDPLRFNFGFIASSDNHAAQPGTGYKESGRHQSTETFGVDDTIQRNLFLNKAKHKKAADESIPFDRQNTHLNLFQYAEAERLGSYFYTGGLVAAHSSGRKRVDIWDALNRKEVYGTSGDRILLWFDLLTEDGQRLPMGSSTQISGTPQFEVRAVGAFEQKPGCPAHSISVLGEQRLDKMCGGECFNPSDTRKIMERIEVIRIRPQSYADEPIADLIDDPWLSLPCPANEMGCVVQFDDPEFSAVKRDVLYYVRAIEQASPTINGEQLSCSETDDTGQCISMKPCYGDSRTTPDNDCLAPANERAWSSPIFIHFGS